VTDNAVCERLGGQPAEGGGEYGRLRSAGLVVARSASGEVGQCDAGVPMFDTAQSSDQSP
jgi:hypothetical protein